MPTQYSDTDVRTTCTACLMKTNLSNLMSLEEHPLLNEIHTGHHPPSEPLCPSFQSSVQHTKNTNWHGNKSLWSCAEKLLKSTPNKQTVHGYSLWWQMCRMCGLSLAQLITSCFNFIAVRSNRQIATESNRQTATNSNRQTATDRQQQTNSNRQTATNSNKQTATDRQQQTNSNRQQQTDSNRQTATDRQQQTNSNRQTATDKQQQTNSQHCSYKLYRIIQ